MNELKFNSAVCTTKEQSQRLLDLGLKPETADMVLFKSYDLPQYPFDYTFNQDPNVLVNCSYVPMVKGNQPYIQDGNIPAWSLHRLIEMICNKECKEHYYFDLSVDYDSMVDVYDSIIEVIERHIKDKFFNKEYLKQ